MPTDRSQSLRDALMEKHPYLYLHGADGPDAGLMRALLSERDALLKKRNALLAAARRAVVALAAAAEREDAFDADYRALSDAIDKAKEASRES